MGFPHQLLKRRVPTSTPVCIQIYLMWVASYWLPRQHVSAESINYCTDVLSVHGVHVNALCTVYSPLHVCMRVYCGMVLFLHSNNMYVWQICFNVLLQLEVKTVHE